MARLGFDLYPLARKNLPINIGLFGKFAYSIPFQSEADPGQTVDTLWTEIELLAKLELDLIDKIWLGVGVGYGTQNFDFGGNIDLVELVPKVLYQYVPVQGEVGFRITPKISAAFHFQFRRLLTIGEDRSDDVNATNNTVGDKFARINTVPFSLGAQFQWNLSNLFMLRAKIDLDRYNHAFVVSSSNPRFDAEGASDTFLGVFLGGGLTF